MSEEIQNQIRNIQQDIEILIPQLQDQIIEPTLLVEKLKEINMIIDEHNE